MKKVTNYLLMFFMSASVLFLASCGEDGEDILTPDTGATITGLQQLDGTPVTSIESAPGESVIINVAYTIDSDVTGATLLAVIGDSAYVTLPVSSTSTSPTQTTLRLPTDLTEDVTIDYQIRGSDGAVLASQELEVTIDAPVLAEVYETVLLAAPLGDRTSETFFSATTGGTYTLQEVIDGTDDIVSDSIHFGYYYLEATGATIASPAEYDSRIYDLGPSGANWGILNDTKFRSVPSLSAEAFDDVTLSSEVEQQFEIPANASTQTGAVEQLTVGQVYAFSFSDGTNTQYGIFRVNALEAGQGEGDSITLTVKATKN